MFHPTKLPHTLAWGSWSLGLAGTGAYCSTYYMVQAMEYYQVLVLPTIYYYIYGPAPMEYYQVLVLPTICRYYVLNTGSTSTAPSLGFVAGRDRPAPHHRCVGGRPPPTHVALNPPSRALCVCCAVTGGVQRFQTPQDKTAGEFWSLHCWTTSIRTPG